MAPERWRQVEQLFLAVVDQSPRDREAFLAQACAGNSGLREEVESLLAYAPGADSLLQAAVQDAAALIPTMETGPPPRETPTLGRYEIIDKIGKGGMGVVYRAIDPAIGRTVAIKTILADETGGKNSPMRARLLRESQAAGRLSHPHIVAIHDVGEVDQAAYIVMEYVEGSTLEQAMREHTSPESSGEALRIVEECASALDYAHSRGVVHRDIKPANIMLEPGGAVKIADFGVAKVANRAALTKTAVIVGSPHYMAPEQWRGESVTGRADQYALASVAYTMLTGREPFVADSLASLAAMTLYREPPSTIPLNARLNAGVDDVLRKALSKSAEGRYATCTEFARALRQACGMAPSAGPGKVGQGSRWVAVAVCAAGLAAVSIGAWLVHAHRAAPPASVPATAAIAAPEPPHFVPPTAAPPRKAAPAPKAPVHVEAGADERIKAYTQAIEASPDYRSYFGRASAYRQLQEYDKAAADYSKAIALKPESAAAYHDRAICQAHLGLDSAAAEDYDRALELDPTNAHTWNARGLIYLKKGGYNKAKDYFSKALELDGNFVEAYENRARAELKLKDAEGAKQDHEKAAALRQEKPKP